MITLLAQWALRDAGLLSAQHDEIQGQLAVVSQEITAGSTGEIAYEILGRKLRIPARGLSEKPMSVGADVVIDRIENGMAFVEEWSVVEQRL